ncbi:MAG: hypothetical protein K2N41_04110 [Lachnospiraceae bacterium]|nr:hypothetical protein [Lachnospiraceae bacterium]MDE7238878.1 hypothetical protein [Lachnospiraceae bacterium]
MNVLRPVFDSIMTIMHHELHFLGYSFSEFGVFMVSIGGILLGIVLKAIYDD